MELFLNLVWLCLSVVVVRACVRSAWMRDSGFDRTAAIAVVLLIVLLFPAISMTDDLMAMNLPAEVQHGIRHHDLSLLHPVQAMSVSLLGCVPFVALAAGMLAYSAIGAVRARSFGFAAKVLAAHPRALGIRGPSTLASF